MPPSSTSSSKRPAGPPWGLAIAIVLLAALELALRHYNPSGRFPGAPEEDEVAYRSVPLELERGTPDVLIVGSSRARRGVLAPALAQGLKQEGLTTTVKNFGLAGAQAEEIELVLRRAEEATQHPKLMVWSISARDLVVNQEHPNYKVQYLWRPADWWTARRSVGHFADTYLPDALRNEAARDSLLVRDRFAFRSLLEEPSTFDREHIAAIFSPPATRGGPMQGELPGVFLKSGRDRSRTVSRERVKRYLGDAHRDPEWPRNYQADHLEAAMRRARETGIPLLLVELPVPQILLDAMPAHAQEKFLDYVAELSKRYAVPFVPVSDLGAKFKNEDFSEQSHLNYRGAQKYTAALVPIVAARLGK